MFYVKVEKSINKQIPDPSKKESPVYYDFLTEQEAEDFVRNIYDNPFNDFDCRILSEYDMMMEC